MEQSQPTSGNPDVKVIPPGMVELIDPGHDDAPDYFRTPQYRRPQSRKRLAVLLFLATCASTVFAGLMMFGNFSGAATYGATLMTILLFHEMGHYLQSVRYHIPASFPYFIPMPITPIGTMGAVIVQGGHVADRKQMYDIAISGPLAGLIIALPAMYFGVVNSQIMEMPAGDNVIAFGNPLIVEWAVELIHRPLKAGEDIQLTPLLFAGWVGIFITALNLIPIGQLDGGHILYTLIGKKAHNVAIALLLGAILYMIFTSSPAYMLMIILLFLMGPRHPPTRDDTVPLGTFRIILGWATLAFIVIGFTPTPIVSN